ncbi:MAG: ABC transporter substrate-binding protein [Rhodospirillales bacterium]
MFRVAIFAFALAFLLSVQPDGLKGSRPVLADDVVKIGVLHSLTGPLAISETSLRDVMMMLIDGQNRKGGLLGKQIEPVVLDPASDPEAFAVKLRQLLAEQEVAAVFGGWTSSSRKAMLPVLKEMNGLLFYPVQYEGQESERNVFYTGAVPNQQAMPAVDYLMHVDGVRKWFLVGSDYVYPQVTNRILKAYLTANAVAEEDIEMRFIPFNFGGWTELVNEIKIFGRQGARAGVISTINGDDNLGFYRELANQGIDAADIPVVAFSVGEEELAGVDASGIEGHLASWGYFQSVDDPANREFLRQWRSFIGDDYRVANDPMEAHYIGFNMWVEAVRKTGTFDVDKVIDAMIGIKVPNLTGGMAEMLPNHHITRPAMIGEISIEGQFTVVWQSPEQMPADAWSEYLPESSDIIADWRPPVSCGTYNTVTKACVGVPGAAN